MTKTPKLSIITVNLNNAPGLRKTLDSVAAQTFTDYEHIIIDGGSNDGSIEVIKEYERQYNGTENGLYWVSEPDKGIYNAMNKGIKVAKGEFLQFLNSGDIIVSKTSLYDIFSNKPYKELICANTLIGRNENYKVLKAPNNITFYTFFNGAISHSATLIKKKVFDCIGYYNEDFKIVSDWEFFLNVFYKSNYKYHSYDINLTKFELGGISTNNNYLQILHKERQTVLSDFSFFIDDYSELKKYKQDPIIKAYFKFKDSPTANFVAKCLQFIRIKWRALIK